jgi:hypothetical protein
VSHASNTVEEETVCGAIFGSRMAERERESYSRIDGIGGSNVARVRSDFAEWIA